MIFPVWLDVLLICLASYRMAGVVVEETWPPTTTVRDWLHPKLPENWQKLLECTWCFSAWTGMFFTLTWWFLVDPSASFEWAVGVPAWVPSFVHYALVVPLTASAVAGNLSDREPGK